MVLTAFLVALFLIRINRSRVYNVPKNFIDNKINKHQHGFIKGKSCLTNLLETMDCIIEIIDQGDPVDIFYFDFKKAFDRVPHNRLLYKIEYLGIKGKVLDIIRDFLTGRSFRVCVGGRIFKPEGCPIRYPSRVSAWAIIVCFIHK